MNELTGNHNQLYEGIQNFGDNAFASFTSDQFDIAGLQTEYSNLNPTNNSAIQLAVELELQERGILSSLSIDKDGTIGNPLNSVSRMSFDEINEVLLLNMVEQFTGENADFVRELADLTTADGVHPADRGQVSREDLREALRLAKETPTMYSQAQLFAIRELYEHMDDMPNNDWWFDETDVGPENILEYVQNLNIYVYKSFDELQRTIIDDLR